MNIYALVNLGTWALADTDIGPFDGETLEAAEREVVDTYFWDVHIGNSPKKFLALKGWELVPMTEAHAAQYKKAE